MPTAVESCVSYRLNPLMCPNECANHGICCECVQAHYAAGSPTSCMNGTRISRPTRTRDPATMALAQHAVACKENLQRNLDFCTCTYEPCGNKGTCCNCIRNHFTLDGTGRTACMRL